MSDYGEEGGDVPSESGDNQPDEAPDEGLFNPNDDVPDDSPDEGLFNPNDDVPDETPDENYNPSGSETITVTIPEEQEQEHENETETEPKSDIEEDPEKEMELVSPEGEPMGPVDSKDAMDIRADLEEWGYEPEYDPEIEAEVVDQTPESETEVESQQSHENELENEPEIQPEEIELITPEGEPIPHPEEVPPELIPLEDAIEKLYEQQQNAEGEIENEPSEMPEQKPEIISKQESESTLERESEVIPEQKSKLISKQESELVPEQNSEQKQKKKRIKAKELELITNPKELDNYKHYERQHIVKTKYDVIFREKQFKKSEKPEGKSKESNKQDQNPKPKKIKDLELITEPIKSPKSEEKYESKLDKLSESQDTSKKELNRIEIVGSESQIQSQSTEHSNKQSKGETVSKNRLDLREKYRQETGKRPIYNKNETKGFLAWLELQKKIVIKKKQVIKEEENEETKEEWQILLEKWIREANESKISKEIKEELIDIIRKYRIFREIYLKLIKLLERRNISEEENEAIEKLFKKLEQANQIQANIFTNLRAFRSLYNQYHIWDMDRILREREKFVNFLTQKLQNLKNDEGTPQVVKKSWNEVLKENLHRITTLSLNQKSQIVKIIQKEKLSEEDKMELVSLLKKLPIEDLISLLGKDFEKHSKNYVRWGWDFYEYIKKDMLNSYIKKNESILFLEKNVSIETLDKIIEKCHEFDIEIKNLFNYNRRTSKLKLECKKCGHGSEEGREWYKTGNDILRLSWKGCPKCIKRSRLIKYFKLLKTRANQKGLEVISDFKDYQNSRSRIKLSCLNPDCLFGQKGEWSRVANSIMESRFHGCPKCNNPQKGNLKSKQEYYKELETLAKLRGGKIVDDIYTNSRKKYEFECKNGHTFKRYSYEIKKGYWCKQCFKDKKLKEMQKIARKKNGKLISTEYVNALTPLIWECNKCFLEGRPFRWSARPADIKNGTWCPKCAGKFKYSMKDMEKFAASRNGHCLSREYKNMKSLLWWKCGECGNEWSSTPTSIIHQGTWCPRCGNLGISERVCRKFFEILFNKEFPITTDLKWLVNEDGYKMHLDGYNDTLRLAFEYNGIQHYIYNKYFYKTEEEFEKRIRDDKWKKELCSQNNVALIIIPYYISFDEMEDFIREECKKVGFQIPETDDKIDWNDFNINPPSKIKEMQDAARKVGIKRYGYPGKCLSNDYLGRFAPLRWECGDPSCRHQWWVTPNNVINHQRWCPRCAGKKYTIEDMQILALKKLNGGKCLSKEYKGVKTHLRWECGICGNKWSATPDNILRDRGCPNWREH